MPQNCDTWDEPVVKAAKRAQVNLILLYLPKSGEQKMKYILEKALDVRKLRIDASALTDQTSCV